MSDNDRYYLTSHPWISFGLDLKNAPFTLWLLLGAAESKCKHLAGIPLRPEKQEELNRVSLEKGVHATTAIEGNTLSEDDVAKISKGTHTGIPKSQDYQRQEVQNMLDAYNAVLDAIKDGRGCGVSFEALQEDNAGILKGQNLKDGIVAGEMRTHAVVVNRYRGAPAEDCAYLVRKLFQWLDEDWGLKEEHPLVEGILKAIMAHLYVAWIHPFGDGNGRSARLLEFRLLMNAGVPLNAAHLLTSYYNKTRSLYYDTLEATSRTIQKKEGNPIAFVLYALQGFVDALDDQIKNILQEQLDVTWENYIHKTVFGGKMTPALRRRRDLLLEISTFKEPVFYNELKRRLSDGLLKLYQDKTPRALMRDLNDLEKRQLIRRMPGYIAAKDRMRAFLPLCNAPR